MRFSTNLQNQSVQVSVSLITWKFCSPASSVATLCQTANLFKNFKTVVRSYPVIMQFQIPFFFFYLFFIKTSDTTLSFFIWTCFVILWHVCIEILVWRFIKIIYFSIQKLKYTLLDIFISKVLMWSVFFICFFFF